MNSVYLKLSRNQNFRSLKERKNERRERRGKERKKERQKLSMHFIVLYFVVLLWKEAWCVAEMTSSN